MPDHLKPRDRQDVESAVSWAIGEGRALEVIGHGSKRGLGRPAHTDATLDLSGLSGVTLYEPEELVLSAQAGTPLADIEAVVAARGQELAFEPMDYAAVLGGPPGQGTIGGAIATNLSGPRRIKAGAARDHFLGVTAVSGRGETFRSGGRVVKNVTGYDLCKLMAGSWGTLGVMTEIAIKVLPRAETEATLVALGLDDETAGRAMAAAMGSSYGVSGAAHLPDYLAARFEGLPGSESATAFRIEGVPPSVEHCLAGLQRVVQPFATFATLGASQSRALWRAIRNVLPFAAAGEAGRRPLWRVSTAPAKGFAIAARLSPATQLYYDWAGGLIWVSPPEAQDAGAGEIRAAVAAVGGHAALVRAPASQRASIAAFEPETGALAELSRRVKAGFDPKGVLNPGRMWAGV